MIQHKKAIKEKRGGEKEFELEIGDDIFVKGVNTRRSKDKPRYQKAQVTGEIVRNIVPIQIRGRDTKVPIKDVRRPPQVRTPPAGPSHHDPGPSTSKNR